MNQLATLLAAITGIAVAATITATVPGPPRMVAWTAVALGLVSGLAVYVAARRAFGGRARPRQ